MGTGAGVRACKAYVELYADRTSLTRELRQAQGQLRQWGSSISTAGAQMLAAGSALLAPLILATKQFMSTGDALDKMSSRVGASVEFLSALGHAAELGGTDIAAMEVGIRKLQRTAYDASRGPGTAKDAFAELGVNVMGAGAQLKTSEQLFMESAAALSRMQDNTRKAALATVVFGKAGTSLLPMLTAGKEGLLAMMEEAKRLGLVMSTQDAKAAAELTDAWTRLISTFKRVMVEIGGTLAPMMKDLADTVRGILAPMMGFVRQNQELAVGLTKTLGAVTATGAALFIVGKAMRLLAAVTSPAGIAVLALTIGIGAMATGVQRANAESAKLIDRIAQLADKTQQAQGEYRALYNELAKLAEKQKLTSDEQQRAAEIIQLLKSRYGDFGATLDSVTGKLTLAADSFDRFNKLQAAVTLQEAKKNLRDLEAQLRKLRADWEGPKALRWLTAYPKIFAQFWAGARTEHERAVTAMEQAITEQRQIIAAGGGAAGGAPAGAPAPGPATELPDLAECERQIEEEERGRWELRQQLFDMQDRREEEIRRKMEATAEERRRIELQTAEERRQIELETERLRIEATLKGREKEMALLAIEKREALRRAAKMMVDPRLIEEQFRLRAGLIAAGEPKDIAQRIAGTFSATAAGGMGMGSWQGKMIEAAKDANRQRVEELRELKEINDELKLVLRFAP